MHSFCESAHTEIGAKSFEISFTDFVKEIIDIDENTSDNVLNPAQIKYLLLLINSFSISRNDYL
tara:strand:+ start:629 stop:820 length:192 start_codon:yes stop_codon:yes gene_type:complete